MSQPRIINVCCYEFQYGLLYLKAKLATSLTDEQVIAEFGDGKGPLLSKEAGQMELKEFNQLGAFTEQ